MSNDNEWLGEWMKTMLNNNEIDQKWVNSGMMDLRNMSKLMTMINDDVEKENVKKVEN